MNAASPKFELRAVRRCSRSHTSSRSSCSPRSSDLPVKWMSCAAILSRSSAPGGAVVAVRHDQPRRERAHPVDQHQRDLLPFAPGQPADPRVRDEPAVRPDAVLVEPAADPQAERQRVAVVDEHHRLAEHLDRVLPQHGQLVDDEERRARRRARAAAGRTAAGGPARSAAPTSGSSGTGRTAPAAAGWRRRSRRRAGAGTRQASMECRTPMRR